MAGRSPLGGRTRSFRATSEARQAGLICVYQDPSLLPDLTVLQNLQLTAAPVSNFRRYLTELGLAGFDLQTMPRELARPTLSLFDLARALAIEPDLLMLDEITASLPANLTVRVFDVRGGLRGTDRSVIFISHRLIEIVAVLRPGDVLREGETVGVVDVTEGSEDRIVALMLGDIAKELPGEGDATRGAVFRSPVARAADAVPRIAAKSLSSGTSSADVSFDLYPGEVLGVVALEGQGQDELFDILAGSERPGGGRAHRRDSGRLPPPGRRDPGRAVYVPADRAEALLMQRSCARTSRCRSRPGSGTGA